MTTETRMTDSEIPPIRSKGATTIMIGTVNKDCDGDVFTIKSSSILHNNESSSIESKGERSNEMVDVLVTSLPQHKNNHEYDLDHHISSSKTQDVSIYSHNLMVWFFGNRKYHLFVLLHIIISCLIMYYYTFERYEEKSTLSTTPDVITTNPCQENNIFENNEEQSTSCTTPDDDSRSNPYQNFIIWAASFTFGLKHMILYQLAFIPLSMCKLLIMKASCTFLNRFIPFKDMQAFHILIGYIVVISVVVAFFAFITMYTLLCTNDQSKCSLFYSEVMITGYLMTILFGLMGVTSYLRYTIPYKLFLAIHQLAVVGYVLTILHTLDSAHRKEGGRYQTYKWTSASFIIYIFDRCTSYFNCRYHTKVLSAKCIQSSSDDSKKTLILDIQRPDFFYNHVGQYAYLRIKDVDEHEWKPFSIASSNEADALRFRLDVSSKTTWTGKLFTLVRDRELIMRDFDDDIHVYDPSSLSIEVMGPYGVPLLLTNKDHSHALLIGVGTGVVPLLSELESHVSSLSKTDYDTYKYLQETHHNEVNKIHQVMYRNQKYKSVIDLCGDPSTDVRNRTKRFHIRLYGYAAFTFNTAFSVLIFGLITSYRYLSFDIDPKSKYVFILKGLQIGYLSLFIALIIIMQSCYSVITVADVFVATLGIIFTAIGYDDRMGIEESTFTSLIMIYVILRMYCIVVEGEPNPVMLANKRKNTSNDIIDGVKLVWVDKSADSIIKGIDTIETMLKGLFLKWDRSCRNVVNIVIYCTDKDKEANDRLIERVRSSYLYENAISDIHFRRPDFERLIDRHIEERIASKTLKTSKTLVGYCGSPNVAKSIVSAKLNVEKKHHMQGGVSHTLDLVIEAFGGTKKK